MRFGLTFGQLHHKAWAAVAVAADELGYESLWLPEHLVLPEAMDGQLKPGQEHPPIDASLPVYDVAAYLGWLAATTTRIRLGTYVYLLGIRHPFVGARAFATLDVLSGGRAICGVGAGWLTTEWEAVGLDPSTRGERLDEAIDVCRRLWAEERVAHDGRHFAFDAVGFEPKPVQPNLPVHVGGESDRALRRAAERGDGLLAMDHTPASADELVRRLRRACDGAGREVLPKVTVLADPGAPTADDVAAYEAAGVDRLIVVPWTSSREAVDGVRRFAEEHGIDGGVVA